MKEGDDMEREATKRDMKKENTRPEETEI